jgi:hypothetical protein
MIRTTPAALELYPRTEAQPQLDQMTIPEQGAGVAKTSEPMTERAYIKHPSNILITIVSANPEIEGERVLNNVSFAGLSCGRSVYVAPGTVIWLRIALVKPPFQAQGKVVWRHARPEGYDLGVEFMKANDAFSARMVEQICYLERYKHQAHVREGRVLSMEQAAREWISRFASEFQNPSRETPAGDQ